MTLRCFTADLPWLDFLWTKDILYMQKTLDSFFNQIGNIEKKIDNNCHLIKDTVYSVFCKIVTWRSLTVFFLAFGMTTQFLCFCIFHLRSLENKLHKRRDLVCVVHCFLCVWVLNHSVMSNFLWPHGLKPTRLFCPWNFPVKNPGVGCHFLLQGLFLTQGWNTHLPHCRWILDHCTTWEALTAYLQPVTYMMCSINNLNA